MAPALATGNTFVYKPSPLSPLTAVLLGEVLAEAGLPPGVFGVVQGEGQTGAVMTKHPGFAKFSFTGSVPTGTKIMQAGITAAVVATFRNFMTHCSIIFF